ncbi:palmitoyltransferase ZDHHC19 isoform X1 [Equus przewalskii]|uniref:Palmitoyltransferase ZDHHC19 isoform X1 n=1 Tax=Equus przewalskii TaxID=9798 RepID=A0ABM4LGL3_EQUPR
MLPSLFAAFNVVLLLILSGLFFAFPCRWLVQNGEWVDPVVTGPLFILTFFSLVSLNVSDPGILHQGSNELGPMMVPVVWVNHRAFRLQWCPRCCFHHPPRTYHCPWCNICVEVGEQLRLSLQFPCLHAVGPVAMPVLGRHAGHRPDVPSVQDSASLLYGRDRHQRRGRTRRRLPGASLRAAAHQGQVGERGRALPRGPVPVPACKQPFRPWLCQKLVFHTFSAARTQVHGRSCRAAESGGARLGAHADPALLDGPLHTQSPSRSWARIWTPGTTSGSLHTGTGSPRQRRSRSCTPPEENPTGRTAASPFLVLRPLSHPDSTAVSRPSTFCHLSVEAGALVLVRSSSLKRREFMVPSHPAVTFMLSWLLGTRFFPSQLPNLVN